MWCGQADNRPDTARSGKSIGEARAVVNIRRGIALPGKSGVVADIQCVSLIVVYGRKSGRNSEDQAARDRRGCLRDLIGIG